MDREKVVKWLEFDYLPRVGAYRKDCKQGCDACMPMHDGDDYCDIDMLCKILTLLKEQEKLKEKLLQNIADNQLTVSPTGYETDEELAKRTGEWNGLQMAYEIVLNDGN